MSAGAGGIIVLVDKGTFNLKIKCPIYNTKGLK
jgi:hypothetical protein